MRGIWGSNGYRIKFTYEGGLAVQYYNKTGAGLALVNLHFN